MKNKLDLAKGIFVIIAFCAYVILANIYKANWIGKEPWSKENLIRVGLFFLVGIVICGGYYYIKYLIRKKYTDKNRENW
jgi:hypothetical protein